MSELASEGLGSEAHHQSASLFHNVDEKLELRQRNSQHKPAITARARIRQHEYVEVLDGSHFHGILMNEQQREHQVSVDVTTRRTFSADAAVCLKDRA